MERLSGLSPDSTLIAVDVGGSKFMVGFVAPDGTILRSERREWDGTSPNRIVEQLVDAIGRARELDPDLSCRAVAGGVTIPGFADPVSGDWIDSDSPPVYSLPICRLLTERTGVPFFGDNDAKACVLAESYFGGGRGCERFLYVTLSSGVGGGVALGGEPLYGARHQCGEIGLTVAVPDGRPSRSGNQRGPLEMYACTEGMVRTFLELGGSWDGLGELGGREVALLARRGDAAATAAVELEGRLVGRTLANARLLALPERAILGGGISLLFDQFEGALNDEVRACDPAFDVSVGATTLGYEGAFLGAAACALRGVSGDVRAAGANGGSCELRLDVVDGSVPLSVVVDGAELVRSDLSAFRLPRGVRDRGRTLAETLPRRMPELPSRAARGDAGAARELGLAGDALGRAIAFACVLLDPGTVRLGEGLAPARAWLEGPVARAVQRDTYWREGEVPYLFEWGR